MPETPVKRGREDDEENVGFFSRLFSTGKKKRRPNDDVEVSTQATTTTLPRLNLASPSSRSPARQPTVTFAVQESVTTTAESTLEAPAEAVATPVQQQRQSQPSMMSRTAPSPWQARPILFHPGSPPPRVLPRRRPAYRPNSRTLVPHRRTRRSKNTAYNKELVRRLLNETRNVFESDPAFTYTTAPGRRQLGTNQSASRLSAAGIRKKVSFDETQVAAATPHVARRQNGAKPRNATPYVRRTESPEQQQDMESPVEEEQKVVAEEEEEREAPPFIPPVYKVVAIAPLPLDFAARPRDENTAPPFVLEGANEFVDTSPRRGTLVAEPLAPSTLGVTHVPVPPPTVGFPVEKRQDEKDSKPAAVPPKQDVSPPGDADKIEPATKRSKPNEGWGDTFIDLDNKDKWKCGVCDVFNPLAVNKCISCDAPRQDGGDTSGGDAAPAPAAASGSIGEGGFSFVAPARGGGVSFSFGAAPTTMPQPFSFPTTTATSAEGATSTGFHFAAASATKSEGSLSPKEQSSKKLRFSMESDGGTTKASDDADASAMPAKDSEEERDSKPAATSFTAFGTAKSVEEEKKEEESNSTAGTGFSFASTTAASTTAPSFSFANKSKEEPAKNDGEKSDATKMPFSFGTQPTANTEPGGFSFGTTSSAASTSDSAPATEGKAPETTTFTFGATKPVADVRTEEEKPAEAPTDSTAMGPPPNKPSFAFGSATPAATSVTTDAAAPSFAFGSAAPSSTTPAAVETPAPSASFGANGSMPQPSFFGGSTPAPAPEQEEGNRKKKRGMANGDTSFFNGPSSSAPAPSFTFGATAPAPATSIAFGSAPATDTSTPFGTSTPAPAPGGTPQFGSTAAPAPSTGQLFAFGQMPASTPAAPPASFGGPAASSTPATSTTFSQSQNGGSNPFGAPSATQAPAPAMSFGSSATAAPLSGAPVTFNFGTSSSSQAPPSFGTPAQPAALNQQGFTGFGGTPAQPALTPAAPFSAPGAPSTTPSFAFGAPAPAAATPATGGFSGFGGSTSFGGTAPTPNIPTGGAFSIGSGGGGGRSSTGRRRIVRAKRPPGSGR